MSASVTSIRGLGRSGSPGRGGTEAVHRQAADW